MTKRFYVITGKGGVGKSTLALSFAHYFQQQNKKVTYIYFEPPPHEEIFDQLSIKSHQLNLEESISKYIAKKLGAVASKWIVKTPFFNALVNMVPGFSYLIFLGDLVNDLQNDPDLTIILDSPSSGHALTMFESLINFSEIFQSGILFDDIHNINQFLIRPDTFKIIICTTPQEIPFIEAIELKNQIEKMDLGPINIAVNNSYSASSVASPSLKETLPPFIIKKMEMEDKIFKQYESEIDQTLSIVPEQSYIKIIEILSQQIDKLT